MGCQPENILRACADDDVDIKLPDFGLMNDDDDDNDDHGCWGC
jgi:hypothetical protein